MANFYKQLNRDKKGPEADFTGFFNKNKKEEDEEDDKKINSKNEKKVKNKKQEPNFLQYQDTTGELPSKKLKTYLWFSRHKVFFYRSSVSLLTIFIFFSFAFSIWKISNYLIFGIQNDRILYNELTFFPDYTGTYPRYSAQPIQILSNNSFDSSASKFDAVAVVFNPNDRFLVKFDFYLDFGGKQTEKQRTFLLPLETRPIAEMGLESSEYSDGYNLVIDNVKWERISNHEIKNLKQWIEERLYFTASNVEFISSAEEGGLEGSILSFDLINKSPFNYRRPEFIVGLYQSNFLAGVLPLQTDNFYSAETKNFNLRSFNDSNVFNEIEVFPIINLFEDESYLEPVVQ